MWTSLLPLFLNQNFHNLLSCFIKALKIIRPDSCLFFYSDADPKDPELEYAVLQIAAQKNVHIAFLIKGTCNTGIPFLARLENSTKATCLKQSLDKGSFSNFVIFYHKIFYKFICVYITSRIFQTEGSAVPIKTFINPGTSSILLTRSEFVIMRGLRLNCRFLQTLLYTFVTYITQDICNSGFYEYKGKTSVLLISGFTERVQLFYTGSSWFGRSCSGIAVGSHCASETQNSQETTNHWARKSSRDISPNRLSGDGICY